MTKKEAKEKGDGSDRKDKSDKKRKMSLAVPDLKGLGKKEKQELKRSTLGVNKDGSGSLEIDSKEYSMENVAKI